MRERMHGEASLGSLIIEKGLDGVSAEGFCGWGWFFYGKWALRKSMASILHLHVWDGVSAACGIWMRFGWYFSRHLLFFSSSPRLEIPGFVLLYLLEHACVV